MAQAAATTALLADGRFTLGLGSGELLNEHVVGELWPRVAVRHEMLGEALDIIRLLFEGGEQSYSGRWLELSNAELFDRPKTAPKIVLAAAGPEAAQLAGEKADGLVGVEADRKLVKAFHDAGGKGPIYGECMVCWASSEKKALETLHRYQRWTLLGWSVLSELPRPQSFEEASQTVQPESFAGEVPCGPDPEPYLKAIDEFAGAGFDHVVLTQAGPDQAGFFKFFEKELGAAIGERAHAEPARAR